MANKLQEAPKTWLISGVAGFIGSNLLETLLHLNQLVVGLDNFATGYQRNLDDSPRSRAPRSMDEISFLAEGDILEPRRVSAMRGAKA